MPQSAPVRRGQDRPVALGLSRISYFAFNPIYRPRRERALMTARILLWKPKRTRRRGKRYWLSRLSTSSGEPHIWRFARAASVPRARANASRHLTRHLDLRPRLRIVILGRAAYHLRHR